MDVLNLWLYVAAAVCLEAGFPQPVSADTLQEFQPGDTVVLPCRATEAGALRVLKWTKEGLGSDYVFHYRDKRPTESFQNPSYRGRVELVSPQMANGDMSISLQNTTAEDAGKYTCQIVKDTEKTSTVTLQVKNDSNLGLKVGLPLGLLGCVAAIAGVVVFVRSKKQEVL